MGIRGAGSSARSSASFRSSWAGLLRTPFQSVEVFIFVIGIFFLIQGVMTFVGAFARKEGRNWGILSGLLGIIAGLIVLIYPISSAVTLALIGGIWLIILGIIQVVAGFQLRSARNRIWVAPPAA